MFRKIVGLFVLATVAMTLAGCDSSNGMMPQSKAGQGAVMGGLGGAALGAALGPGKALQNAAIGGAAGAIGGSLIGGAMDKNEQNAYQQGYYDGGAPAPRSY